jgi:hypothetical protein
MSSPLIGAPWPRAASAMADGRRTNERFAP